jgi:TrpR-related protein YerC/YecD
MKNWKNKQTKELIAAVLNLRNSREASDFFRDLLTPEEIVEFGKRWQAAQLLSQKVSYKKIEKITGLSSTTVARVSRWLNRGKGGYRLAISRLGEHKKLSALAKRPF